MKNKEQLLNKENWVQYLNIADEECLTNNAKANDIVSKIQQGLTLPIDSVMPRSFGMVRWYSNTDGDVACVSIERAKEYVETYNKLSGKEDCYVDEEVWLLLNEV